MPSISFTGHRTLSKDTKELSQNLYKRTEEAIKSGVTDFYFGGAYGWDQFSFLVVLKLREKYPHIRLNLVLPCSNNEQTENWSEKDKVEFYRILSLADSVEYTSEHYFNGCMKLRNARLVEYADICFCYFDPKRQRSGTAQTVRMAQKKSIPIFNFWSEDK